MKTKIKTKTKMKKKMKTKTKILVFIFKFYCGTSRLPYRYLLKDTNFKTFLK